MQFTLYVFTIDKPVCLGTVQCRTIGEIRFLNLAMFIIYPASPYIHLSFFNCIQPVGLLRSQPFFTSLFKPEVSQMLGVGHDKIISG
jgi:hypothetical protein